MLKQSLLTLLSVIALTSPALAQSQISTTHAVKTYPLPGRLDYLPMLNSNSPEVVQKEGILVSTLPGLENDRTYLNYAFKGPFGVFVHHIAKDEMPGENLLYLGMVASNQTDKDITVSLLKGASYLSQPDAIFRQDLAPMIDNPMAQFFAGPGDRVASELIVGKSQIRPQTFTIPARSNRLIYNMPIPTDVVIPPPINGRSSLFYMQSNGPIYLSHIAAFAKKENNRFVAPSLERYREILNKGDLAGPRKFKPTPYNPTGPKVKGGVFEYARVAGVQEGVHWKGSFFQGKELLQMPAPGERVGYPLSGVYLKRLGTDQNQAANMLTRYPDTAIQAHGNYGVHYDLHMPINNTSGQFRTYQIHLDTPAKVAIKDGKLQATYLNPPNRPVMFRGTVKVAWIDEYKQPQTLVKHLVMRHGEEMPPLAMITVPPQTQYDVSLDLIYPADSTPPQLLSLERIE